MSVTAFAEHLGAAERTVAGWSSRGSTVRLRPLMQAALDAELARASSDVIERFNEFRDGEMRRRDLMTFAGASATASARTLRLVGVFLADILPAPQLGRLIGLQGLTEAVATLKSDYQACRYEQVLEKLATILPAIEPARAAVSSEDRSIVEVRAADLYHVVGSVLLKLGDPAMALIAAERSCRYAAASDDPLVAGRSARIMTHALLSNGHADSAVDLAQLAAQKLEETTRLDGNDAIAIYGALLLRGAVAAAQVEDRHRTEALLEGASRAATMLGHDGNDCWTGFGPANVMQHRAHIALTFGDAGSAISIARRIHLHKITLTERQASLFVDVAQAYQQWGRYEKALSALRMAHHIAPEEVRGRPAVHQIVSDLVVMSRGPIGTQVRRFAGSVGVPV